MGIAALNPSYELWALPSLRGALATKQIQTASVPTVWIVHFVLNDVVQT